MAGVYEGSALAAGRIVKTMSLSRSEFAKSIEAFAGQAASLEAARSGRVMLPAGDGQVMIAYDALPSQTFGGLLELPRAEVSLSFEGGSQSDREAFVRAFDLAFQRGGG